MTANKKNKTKVAGTPGDAATNAATEISGKSAGVLEELIIANKQLAFQNDEKGKRAAELAIANKELAFQNEEKGKRAAELTIANKELAFQNEEKEKRAAELVIANKDLVFQNEEKEKRAAELAIANKELAFQNEEKGKRAAELAVANKELAFQNDEKEKRAAELAIANKDLVFQNEEKEKRAAELLVAQTYLDNLIGYANAPIIVWDPQHRITRFNRAFESLTGQSASVVLGQTLDILFPPDQVKSSMELIRKAQAGERLETVEIGIRYIDGTTRTVLWNSATIFDPDGKTPVSVIAQGQDITTRKKAESDLRETKEYLENLIGYANAPIIVWDPQYRITRFNRAFESLTGRRASEVLGQSLGILFPQDQVIKSMELISDAQSGKRMETTEIDILSADGMVHTVLWNSAPILAPDGLTVTATIAQGQDITKRKRADEMLRESEARYRTLVESIPQKILMKDRKFRWASINENLAHDFGLRPEEVVGKMDADLFLPELAAKYHADDVRIMETGKTEELEERYIQEGRETWVNTIKTPVRDANGKITGILGVFWDITERKRAEAALQESEKRFRELSESLPLLIWTCRGDGRCDYLSPQWVEYTGVTEAEQLGFGWLDQLHPDDRQRTVAAWNEAVELNKDFDVEFRLRRKDGIYRYFKVRAVAFRNDKGQIVKWFGTNTDIDDLRQAEGAICTLNAELEQRVAARTMQLGDINKELEAFCYSVSHDLRTPLRSIDGFSLALLEDYEAKLDAEGKAHLHRIRGSAQHMGFLIDDLLKLSRVSRAEFVRERVDLSALAQAVVNELRSAQPERDVECVIQKGLLADGDARLLRIALDNLLGNAWKFTGRQPKARIEFDAVSSGGGTTFFVRDNGAGFDMKYGGKLFGAFQRLHKTEDFAGTGIGLATVQRVVARHGGRVWAEASPGKGATFFFTVGKIKEA